MPTHSPPVDRPAEGLETMEPIDLDRLVLALLNFTANRLNTSGSATYRNRCGVGFMDFRIMMMLEVEPGCSATRVAETIGLDKAAVSRSLRGLEKRGLVAITAGAGRVRALRLTAEGAAVYKTARGLCLERERRLLSGLSEAEQETFRRLLQRLLAATPYVAELATDR